MAMIATALANIAPAAGPGAKPPETLPPPTAPSAPGGCSAGPFLGDFWSCSRAAR
jgi:hypothetical protein